MKFTKQAIDAMTLPEGKTEHFEWDDGMPGFGVRLRPGSVRFVVQYRAGHRQRRLSLGDVRRITVEDARAAAKKVFAKVTLGLDPSADKDEARAAAKLKFGALAEQYLARKVDVSRPNTYRGIARYLMNHWKPFRDRPIHAVTRRDVAARLNQLTDGHGPVAAARARSTLSAFFVWAMREGLVDQNPAIGTNDPAAGRKARDRVMTDYELAAIWRACRDDNFGRIVRMLVLTGARRQEIGGLHWSEIDLESGKMIIPGSRTKNRRELVLILPPLALSILEATPRRESSEFVFGSRGGPFSAWSRSTENFKAHMGKAGAVLAPWTLHDLRRSVATGMAEIGIQPHVIEAVLNHQSGHKRGVAGIYNRAAYEREVRTALALWAEHVEAIVAGRDSKIVSLKAQRPA
jgi:integrase